MRRLALALALVPQIAAAFALDGNASLPAAQVTACSNAASCASTTPAFSTTHGNVTLVAVVGSANGGADIRQPFTISGAGLTWTRIANDNDFTLMWVAYSASPLTNVTVTGTAPWGAGNYGGTWIGVQAWTGGSGVTGASAARGYGASTGGTTYAGPSLTTTAPGSLVVTWFEAYSADNFTGSGLLVAGLINNAGHLANAIFSISAPTVGSYSSTASNAHTNASYGARSVELLAATAATPTASPGAATYTSAQSVTLSTTLGGVICYTTDGSTPATNGSTGCTTGTLYSSAVSVAASLSLKAVSGGTGYADSSVASFAYVINYAPTVTSITPNHCTTRGACSVTITGTNFRSGASATFGGTACTSLTVVSPTTITCTVPAHAAGHVDVTVSE